METGDIDRTGETTHGVVSSLNTLAYFKNL
jgi:hypothetical protein